MMGEEAEMSQQLPETKSKGLTPNFLRKAQTKEEVMKTKEEVMNRPVLRWISFVMLLVILGTGVQVWAATPSGQIVVALDSLGDHLDPHRPPGNAAHCLMALFDGLTEFDAQGNIEPALATSWEIVGDTTWRFHIREGVVFHNGESLDANTIKGNLDRMMDPNEPRASYNFSVIASYSVVDEYTLDVTTVGTDPLMPYRMADLRIAPTSMLGNPKSTDFNKHPVGTGPFKFVEWIPDERIVLEAFDGYFQGAPSVKTVVFKSIPEKSTQIAELITGGVDIVENVPPELVNLVKGSSKARIETIPDMVNHVIQLRSDIDSPLSNKKVRQALNYAVDVQSIIDTLLGGYAHREATVVHPFVFGYNADVTPYNYDPDKAKALLADAGYPDGFKVEFDVCPAIGDLEVAQAIVAQLAQVGIEAQLNSVEYGLMRSKVLQDKTVAPMFWWQWKTWWNDPDSVMQGLFASDSIASFTRNAALDALITAGRYNSDQNAREQIYGALQVLLKEEAPAIFLYYLDSLYGISNRVDWQPRTDGRLFFYNATVQD